MEAVLGRECVYSVRRGRGEEYLKERKVGNSLLVDHMTESRSSAILPSLPQFRAHRGRISRYS